MRRLILVLVGVGFLWCSYSAEARVTPPDDFVGRTTTVCQKAMYPAGREAFSVRSSVERDLDYEGYRGRLALALDEANITGEDAEVARDLCRIYMAGSLDALNALKSDAALRDHAALAR